MESQETWTKSFQSMGVFTLVRRVIQWLPKEKFASGDCDRSAVCSATEKLVAPSETNEVKGANVSINFTLRNSIFQKAVMTLAALSLLQLAVGAQSRSELIVTGQTGLAGLAPGEMMRFTAFNPVLTNSGDPNEPISLRLRVFDSHGDLIASSPQVEIPPGQFRWIDFDYDDLPIAGEPDTMRKQVRTVPLWGLRARGRLLVSTSLDLVNSNTGAGTFRFFFNIEALP